MVFQSDPTKRTASLKARLPADAGTECRLKMETTWFSVGLTQKRILDVVIIVFVGLVFRKQY
tara:strand:- start:1176 stop:1361 length:186 start_codon:yes stop_codon:yes gene_type:complete